MLNFLPSLRQLVLQFEALLLDSTHGGLMHLTIIFQPQKELRIRFKLLLALLVLILYLAQLHLQVLAQLSQMSHLLAGLYCLSSRVKLGCSGLLLGKHDRSID